MLIILGSEDKYLTGNVRRIVQGFKLLSISTNTIERILKELKTPDKCVIIDMTWEAIQEHGVLRQIVNVARISGNIVACMCPNQDEDLKKLAKQSRADHVFIRYDTETTFKEFIKSMGAS